MRISNKTAVQSIIFLLKENGVRHVVYSPGSRNAPFAISLDDNPDFEVHVKVDERSAAFFALGLAQQLHQPVVLICTSGTAPLNYSPAIAEAFYQEIPLIVLTADRPSESINMSEGQCINQVGIYDNFIKRSVTLKEEAVLDEDVTSNHNVIAETIKELFSFPYGPVHINFPFHEPLYGTAESPNPLTQMIVEFSKVETNSPTFDFEPKKQYLILMGQNADSIVSENIRQLISLENVLVLTETHSNAHALGAVDCIDRWITSLTQNEIDKLHWDVVISLGHNIISRKIKALIKAKAKDHWSVQWQKEPIDTYRLHSKVFNCSINSFLDSFVSKSSLFVNQDVVPQIKNDVVVLGDFFAQRPYSDLKLFYFLSQSWPQGAQVQMGNSSVVRYIQLFQQPRFVRFFGNRGVSGIDGSTSTAVGAAVASNDNVIFVTGDLSFLYDANGLWHNPWPKNLKIIVVDNSGGGIFRIIDGAKNEPAGPTFFEAPHQRDILKWVQGWGLRAMEVHEPEVASFKDFFESDNCEILIVKTPANLNPIELDLFFEFVKHQNERVENN